MCANIFLLQNTGHMNSFVLVSEEAISKGIRRIVALTGPEALRAEKKCHSLEERVENVQNLVDEKMKDGGLNIKETSQEITRISEVRNNPFVMFCISTAINFLPPAFRLLCYVYCNRKKIFLEACSIITFTMGKFLLINY